MDLSPHNIKRITEWIQSEVGYNFLNSGYTIAFKDEQVVLEQSEKEQTSLSLLLISFTISVVLLNADTSHVFHVLKNFEDIYLSLK